MSLKRAALTFAATLAVQSPPKVLVKGHGYLETPRSRNLYAHEVGPSCSGEDCPPPEYCHHCLNTNTGVCGKFDNRIYETANWFGKTGDPMPWMSQATYTEGETITVDSFLSTHHNGHMEIRACVIAGSDNCTESDHFEGNELHFVKDNVRVPDVHVSEEYRPMPADPNYPERGMYAGGQAGGIQAFSFDFKLPDGIAGERVLLQWKYITANSCSPPGYAEYFANHTELPGDYWTQGVTQCTPPYPDDGSRSTTYPEQFFNCAEVTILPSAPTISPKPTQSPTTDSPTVSESPTGSPIVGGPPPCLAQWQDCTYDSGGCCGDLLCTQIDASGYRRCLVADTCSEGPDPAPSPTPANGCCYDRNSGYQVCMSAESNCNESESACNGCGGLFLSAPLVRTGCCSWGGDCSTVNPDDNKGCQYLQSDCEGDCNGTWQSF